MFALPYLIALLGIGLVEAGLIVTGIAMVAIAFVAAHFRERLEGFLDRGPAVDVIQRSTPGLSDRQVHEFFTLHQEYKQIQKEKREEKEREMKNAGANAGGQSLNTR